MLRSVWTWWRIYSFLSMAILVTFGSAAITVFVFNFLFGYETIPRFAVVSITVTALLVLPLLVTATMIGECLRTGEKNKLTVAHVKGALLTVAMTLCTMIVATNLARYFSLGGNWAFVALPFFVWRVRLLLAHPRAHSLAILNLWRHKVPPFEI